jgi:tetratricopeptide (TPR) repeat protein
MVKGVLFSIVLLFLFVLIGCEDHDEQEAVNYHLEAYNLEARGEYREAIIMYNKALEQDPDNDSIYLNRGNARSNLGNFQGALKDYNKALKINPELGVAYFNRALLKESSLNDTIGALEDYETTIRVEPSYEGVFFNYALLLQALDRHDEALSNYNEHMRRYGQDSFALYYMALSFYAKNDRVKGDHYIETSCKLGNQMACDFNMKNVQK